MQRVIYCINFMIFGCPELHEGDEGCPWVGLDGVGATGGGPAAGAGRANGGAVAFWRRWSESERAKGRGGRGGRGEAHRMVHSGGEGPEGGGQRWGRSSACCNNGGRAGGPISGRGRARTARGGAAKLRGEAREVLACGIEVGRQWWTPRTPAAARQRLSPARARAGRRGWREKDRALERIRMRPRGSRGSPTADAWWSSPDCAGRGMGACTGGAEEHCGVANEISLILTAQNSKFHIGT